LVSKIQNCTFRGNAGIGLGTIFSAINSRETTNKLELYKNMFIKSTSEKHGAVFFFKNSKFHIEAAENQYLENYAKKSGTIWYFYTSDVQFNEKDSIYTSKYLFYFI